MNNNDYYTVKSNNANTNDKPERISCSGITLAYMNIIMILVSFLLMNQHSEIPESITSKHSVEYLILYVIFALLAADYNRITIAIPNKKDNLDKSTIIMKALLSVVLLRNVILLFFTYTAFTFINSIILLDEILIILPDELSLDYKYNESTEELLKPYRKQQKIRYNK